ncbi:MAG: DUF1460 domain-containing protein [Bacteroidales bacterium]|jgi:hypothetical protein|nr:DUF1460 domain-containing protein [Bacteroidales bacterium]
MKRVIISIIVLMQFAVSASLNGQNHKVYSESKDREIFANYISVMKGKENLPIEKLMVETAKFFLSVPYVAHTLELEPEGLVINLRGLDCTTFVETVIALSKTIKSGEPSFEKFGNNLALVRYREGKITGYQDRLHYTTDWMYENEKKGLITRVIHTPQWTKLNVDLNIMSSNPDKYKQLSGNEALTSLIKDKEREITSREHLYLPADKIEKNKHLFKSGDIVGFTTNIKGVDVSHMGIIYKEGSHLSFIHASLSHKKVLVNREPLSEYIKKTKGTGVVLARVNE